MRAAFARALAVAITMVAILAIPVALAARPEEERQRQGEELARSTELERQVAEQQAALERRRAERRTPEAAERRRASRTRYRDLGAREAASLAADRFAGLFSGPDRRLLRLPTGQKVVRWLGDSGAVVDLGEGKPNGLVSSTGPVRATDDSGELAPADLDLEQTPAGFEPKNAPTDIRIATNPSAGVAFPAGFSVGHPDAQQDTGFRVRNEIFYPEVDTDTDMWVTPRARGAELSYQLRSAASPEEHALEFELPAGGRLAEGRDGQVDVVKGDEVIGSASAPVVWDADGEPLPATQEVVGDRLVVGVAHRDRDVNYPVVIDPIVWQYNLRQENDWPPYNWVTGTPYESGGDFMQYWSTDQNLSFWGRGAYSRRRSDSPYTANAFQDYRFYSLRASYLQGLSFQEVFHSGAWLTHVVVGIASGLSWENVQTRSDNFGYWNTPTYGGSTSGGNRASWRCL